MEIHDRLHKVIADQGISISKFERIIGVGQNSISTCLRRRSSVRHEVLQGIVKHFPEYSIEWLVTGNESSNKKIIQNLKSLIGEMNLEINKID